MELIQYLQTLPYVTEVVTILAASHALAMAIVNLTPTPVDDGWVKRIYTGIEWLAGIISPKAKQP